MPLSINAATSGSIHAIMENLVASPPASLPFPVKGMSKRRWMVDTDAGPIVQLECLDAPGQAIVFATTARDGSGPLRAAFTTMLLLEDTIANSMHPYGVCSGEATITIYRFVDLTDATRKASPAVWQNLRMLPRQRLQSVASVFRAHRSKMNARSPETDS